MQVQDAMTRAVVVCEEADRLDHAAQLMWDGDCGVLPVATALGTVIGILTDRDICMAAYTKGLPLRELYVRDAMARAVHTCRPTDSIESALALMRDNKVRRIPVVEHGRSVGMLSLSDLLAVLRSSRLPRHSGEPYRAALLETLVVISAKREVFGESGRDQTQRTDPAAQPAVARGN